MPVEYERAFFIPDHLQRCTTIQNHNDFYPDDSAEFVIVSA